MMAFLVSYYLEERIKRHLNDKAQGGSSCSEGYHL